MEGVGLLEWFTTKMRRCTTKTVSFTTKTKRCTTNSNKSTTKSKRSTTRAQLLYLPADLIIKNTKSNTSRGR